MSIVQLSIAQLHTWAQSSTSVMFLSTPEGRELRGPHQRWLAQFLTTFNVGHSLVSRRLKSNYNKPGTRVSQRPDIFIWSQAWEK